MQHVLVNIGSDELRSRGKRTPPLMGGALEDGTYVLSNT